MSVKESETLKTPATTDAGQTYLDIARTLANLGVPSQKTAEQNKEEIRKHLQRKKALHEAALEKDDFHVDGTRKVLQPKLDSVQNIHARDKASGRSFAMPANPETDPTEPDIAPNNDVVVFQKAA